MQSKVDLLKVDKVWAVGNKSLSSIELAAEKIGTRGKSLSIQKIATEDMQASLDLDIEACQGYQRKENVKEFYETKIRPALEVRGLISPYPLSKKQGIEMHKEFERITLNYPKYITSFEFTVELTSMPEKFWSRCFDFLSEQRCIVIEEWDKPLGVSIGIFLFDRTIAFDGSNVYRGESDASHNTTTKKSMACCVVWNHKVEVLSSIFVKDFESENSNVAEVVDAIILLKEAMRMGLHKEFFQNCSDSKLVYHIGCGLLYIDLNDTSDGAKKYKLLKYMRSYFDRLLPRWESRDKMFLVDGVMREMGRQNMLSNEEKLETISLVHKTAYYITGNPVFRLGKMPSFINGLRNQRSSPFDLKFEDACYVKIEEEHKIDALWHIASALRPIRMHIMMVDSEERADCVKEIKYLFGDNVSRITKEGYCLFTIDLTNIKFPTISARRAPKKKLMVLFDAAVSKQECQKISEINDAFTVSLAKASETDLVSNLPKLSPLSFLSFHQAISAHKI